jgi:hypothetical protein
VPRLETVAAFIKPLNNERGKYMKVWTYTKANMTLWHAFRNDRAVCRRDIRPAVHRNGIVYKELSDLPEYAKVCPKCSEKLNGEN